MGEDYERVRPEIDPGRGRVFVGSADHGLYALRAGDGSSIWRFETLGVVQCEPYYDAELDVVYFGSHDGALYAVHAQDGSLVWRFNTGAEVARKPVRNGEVLYVANAADQLFAIDRRKGKLLWNAHRTPALGMEIAGHAGPAYAHGLVFMAYSDGHVAAYNAINGSEKWTPVDLSAEAERSFGDAPRYLDVDTTPVVAELSLAPSSTNDEHESKDKVVFVASYAGGVFALDAATGSRVWSNEQAIGVTDLLYWYEPSHTSKVDPNEPLMPARRLLVASSGVSGIWALDPHNGHMVWRLPLPEGGATAPVKYAGGLLLGTTRYGLFLLSPRNGRVIDGIDLGTGFASTPATYGVHAYVMSNAGTFLGLQVDAPR